MMVLSDVLSGRFARRMALGAGVVLLLVGGYGLLGESKPTPPYRFAEVARGPLTATVSATGTLNAVTTVQVGSQVSGQIKELLADFNSEVRAGQVIARIDPATFEAKVGQAQADLLVARAAVFGQQALLERARADLASAQAMLNVLKAQLEKTEAELKDAKRNLERRADLFKRGYSPESERDKAQATYDSAVALRRAAIAQAQAQESTIAAMAAQIKVAEAQIETARATVQQKEAALKQAEIDVAHTFIRSPVDGVVVSRNVDIGQTVAASLQAPILFLIAQDLTRMQVNASVDEADVGRIAVAQKATFTIDAFPGETFQGAVIQIRKAAVIVQNVVTYDVVVTASNPQLKLLPGMTANLRFLVAERADVLKVPNAALRYRPPGVAREQRSRAALPPPVEGGGLVGRAWILGSDGEPKPVRLKLGVSDGEFTEILAGELAVGQKVIVGAEAAPKEPTRRGLRLGF
jgi:HlyD family secretion protein